jgi:hypothetical protein
MDNKVLNSICFTQSDWKLIAQGFDTERWFADGQGIGSGGISNPSRINLMQGSSLLSFYK